MASHTRVALHACGLARVSLRMPVLMLILTHTCSSDAGGLANPWPCTRTALHTYVLVHTSPCTPVLSEPSSRACLCTCVCVTPKALQTHALARACPPPTHTRVSSYTHTRVLAHACNSPGEKRTTESCSFPSDPPASGCCVSVSNTTHLWGTHTTGGGLGGPMGYGGRWGSCGCWGGGAMGYGGRWGSYGCWGGGPMGYGGIWGAQPVLL